MGGQGSNPNAMDHQSNEDNQFTIEALDCESEEWMEECHSILNSDEPISLQDLLAEGGILATPRDGNVDIEMTQVNSKLSTAPSPNNDVNRGKNLIINLDDESEDDGIDAMCPSYKRELPDGNSHGMLVGETSRAIKQREVSQEDINLVNNQANCIDLEQGNVQVHAVQPHNPTAHVPILASMLVPPPMQPLEIPAPYRPAYYNTDAQPFYRQLIWSTKFDNVPAPGIQMGNTPNRPTNMNYQMFTGNMASSSRNPTASHAYRPSNVLYMESPRFC